VGDPNKLEKETDAQAAVTGLKIALMVIWVLFVALIGLALGEQHGNARSWEVAIVALALSPMFVAPVAGRIWRWIRGISSDRQSNVK
jgi:hypothetical protein